MSSVKKETLSGFNEQIQSIKSTAKKTGIDTKVTLVQFSTDVQLVYSNVPTDNISEFTDYSPNGLTAMYDGVRLAIETLEKDLEEDTNCLVVIISDGQENNSQTKQKDLAEKIQSLQSTKRWTFTYMGANQDLSEIQENLYIPKDNISLYQSTGQGTLDAFHSMSRSSSAYLTKMSVGEDVSDGFYEDK